MVPIESKLATEVGWKIGQSTTGEAAEGAAHCCGLGPGAPIFLVYW